MKDIIEILDRTAEEYLRHGIAQIRHVTGEEDEDLDYRGSILTKDKRPGKPVGMIVVVTHQPMKSLTIMPAPEEDDGAYPPDVIPQPALEELAGIVSFGAGRACILWVNAGLPAVVSSDMLVNVARRFQTDLGREDQGQALKPKAREVAWDACTVVQVLAGRRQSIVWDWLKASKESGEAPSYPSARKADASSPPVDSPPDSGSPTERPASSVWRKAPHEETQSDPPESQP